jgi:hypothetical protein
MNIGITILIVVSVSILVTILWALARAITIEKQVKNQFQLPQKYAKHHSPDRLMMPTFTDQEGLPSDLSQMYFYHDCLWRNSIVSLPGKVIKKIAYRKNNAKDPPVCIIIEVDDIMYVLFRSTRTTVEMLRDIDMSQVCDIHKGFRDIYNSVSTDIIGCIKEHSKEKVVIFGHSLGGALVDLLSDELIRRYSDVWQKCQAISSGAPRVFAPNRADSFAYHKDIDRYMKVINEADMVPFHPSTATTVEGLFSTGKKYFYKSFPNQKRIFRFNRVIETQVLDSHMSNTYSNAIWNTSHTELPVMYIDVKIVD